MVLPDWAVTSLTQVGFYGEGSNFSAQEVMCIYSEPKVAIYKAGEGQGLLTDSEAYFLLDRINMTLHHFHTSEKFT